MSTALEQLATTLKTDASQLSGLSSLETTQLLTLNTLIENAQQKQRQILNDAIEEGLSYVPALLRGAVKAIVRG
jgi:uncharacterized protein YoxC